MSESGDVSSVVPHPVERGRSRNLQIQWLRSVAAISVLLFHASTNAEERLHDGRFLELFDGRFGLFGVSLFFAISGYLMAIAIRVQEPFAFLSHRVIRIYPIFFCVYALHYLANWALGAPYFVDYRVLLLAPVGWTIYPLGVEWTLVFEVTFYLSIFAIAVAGLARLLPWIALFWLGVLAVSTSLHVAGAPFYPLQEILAVSACIPLAGGLLIPSLLRLGIAPAALIVAGISFCAAQSLLHPASLNASRWLYGAGATLLLAGIIGLSARNPALGDNRAGRILARTGDYSYALYLVHVPIICAIYTLQDRFSHMALWSGALAAALLASAIAGHADLTMYNRLKARLKTVPSRLVKGAMLAYIALFLFASLQFAYRGYVTSRHANHARALMGELALSTGVFTAQDAETVARANGFVASDALLGNVEIAGWKEATLGVRGWALDTGKAHEPPILVFFQGGNAIGSAVTDALRPDVRRAYRATLYAGYEYEAAIPCRAGSPVIVLAITATKRFAVLPNHLPDPVCR